MLTMLLSMFTVMASASVDPTDLAGTEDPCEWGHDEDSKIDAEHYPATEGDCITKATREYWKCNKCGKYFWLDDIQYIARYITSDTRPEALNVNPNVHFALKYVAAKDATCTEDGNQAYYHCDACKKNFTDEDGTVPFTGSVVIPATGNHKLEPVAAEDPTCTKDGHEAYWKCSVCKKMFSDEAGTTEISAPVKRNKTGHAPIEVPGKIATCTEEGRQTYYICKTCQKEFKDAGCTQEITDPSWKTIPKIQHQLLKTDEKPATCTENGTKAYWTCSVCKKMFSDEKGTQEIERPETISALGHTLTKTDYKAATRTEEGNIAYWHCSVCDKYFADEACTNEITKAQTVIPKLTGYTISVEQVGDHGTFKIRKKLDNGKWGNWWTAADEDVASIEISNLKKGTSYQIKAVPGTNYEASWKVNNKTATVDNDIYTATINKNDISVEITFTKIDTKNLKLSVDLDERHGKLKYYDDDEEKWVTYDDETWTLSKGDKVEFKVVPDSGYKAVWQLGSGSKTSATYYDVTYRDMDGKNRTLHVDFVKKSSSDVDDYPTLTFDITGGKHGTVSRNGRQYTDGDVISIKKNDKMTFKAKADKGYVAVWTYKGDTYVGDEYTVKMGANDAKLYVEFMDKDDIRLTELPFRDVSKRDWYYDDVVYVYRKGYMDGMSSTRFGGELNTTRGQIVTILWRLTGEPRATKRNPFTDVSSSQYYYDAISWAYDAGVVDGFDAHTFKPDQNVTREQLAAILYRYAKYMNLSTSGSAYLAKYTDADKIANWAYDAMAWANYRGLINGTSATRIDPKGYATRAQIAAILHRFAVEYGA